jgi:TonB family protein
MGAALVFSLFLSWVQVSSATYIVKSSAGEERAKRVLKELEDFHQLIGTLAFRNTELPELPIEVLLIGDEATLKELEPEYNGRRVPVAGYYQRGQDRDFIVLSGRVFPETLTSVVYHELSHYFLARALASRPTWLNEGLAEYFAAAEIREDEISLGAVSADRVQVLRTGPMLPLKTFFAVNSDSPYYNESSKASLYYAQAWAFMHYMMHGEHAQRFRQYLNALQTAESNLVEYLNVSERDLETGFQNYLRGLIQRAGRNIVKVSGEDWSTKIESIPELEAQISIAEIFLANGKLPDARRHLERLAAQAPDSTRISYYRGILARIAGDPFARDFFVDALLDPLLGPRAAVQLVLMGDTHIPAIRSILEETAASGTRNSEVYLALTKIYSEDVRQIEETVRLAAKSAVPDIPAPVVENTPGNPEALWRPYAQGAEGNVHYELMSESDAMPAIKKAAQPFYPAELQDQKVAGEVVVDLQVTDEGRVGGVWLVSSTPDVFANLATSAVREWQFDPVSAKIRIVLRFRP